MKDLIVITAASGNYGTLPLYRDQLSRAQIDFYVDDISGKYIPPLGGNFAMKLESMRRLSQQFSTYQRIVFTDAFDVTFWGDRDSLISKIPLDYVLWGAEKNCYPNHHLAEVIPNWCPARFANGGLLCGTPQSMLDWCDRAESHPLFHPNILDQQWLNQMLAENSPLVTCDHVSKIFFCLFGGYPELEFERGLPVNALYNTHPHFIHANGKWSADEMWRRYEESIADHAAESYQ